ncbi:hypothetical protein HNR60_004277 [Rhodopseudomonas rhenobacensis]|uniref:Uncharacterized protein n=1 Tax=Rhodopseudomonas rhenobacensis TaxID=87461 RepID=A0A7W7Z7S8_9BRAD|nr:hypothetical protein [Rhodopseudomonas rhenobacensis]MBB5049499.1 hypothetical protein [Rhodopseudomonas rhenobacensis]
MPDPQNDSLRSAAWRDSVSPNGPLDAQGAAISDDECLRRLEVAVGLHDVERLDEVASLIGRLAVPLEC